MAYAETGRVWNDYLTNVNKTISLSKTANQTCEDTIKLMWLIDSQIFNCVISRWGRRKLPNHQVFVSAFYRRNIIYLQSSHALASIGFINPSSNLCRTVFESLQRGYLFVVEMEETDEYFQVVNTPKEDDYNFKKGAGFLRKKLYSLQLAEAHWKFYKVLCTSSHASIKGTLRDFPNYLPDQIEEILKTILLLMYGNIEMMAECYFDFLDIGVKGLVKDTLETIASEVGFTPLFEPDKEVYSSKLRLKKGNFLDVL